VVGTRFQVAKPDCHAGLVELIDRRRRLDMHPEHRAHRRRVIVEERVAAVQVDGSARRAPGRRDARDVIDMRVRQEDLADGQVCLPRARQQVSDRVAGIHDHGFASVLTADNVSVFLEGAACANFHYHGVMVLAVVDDLMFTSKIKTTARQVGVDIAFARSSEAALAGMRAKPPALVILDLNNSRTDPLGTVAAMKGDPTLASIPTVGFVSHVQAELIDAARAAGVDDILARSAFTARLAEILTGR